MNPEFLAKFTLGGKVAMILRRKHHVHQSTNPFKTESYSWPRHLAASFPFTARSKNRNTPLPNSPIRWRTLYFKMDKRT